MLYLKKLVTLDFRSKNIYVRAVHICLSTAAKIEISLRKNTVKCITRILDRMSENRAAKLFCQYKPKCKYARDERSRKWDHFNPCDRT
jgi:hypothetical protein